MRSEPQDAAAVERAQADPARPLPLTDEDAGDQVARQHEERRHADVRAVPPDRRPEVREHDEPDRDGTQPVEIGAIRDPETASWEASGVVDTSRASSPDPPARMATQYQCR